MERGSENSSSLAKEVYSGVICEAKFHSNSWQLPFSRHQRSVSCPRRACLTLQGGSSDIQAPAKRAKFDGGYASTMQGAEAFFNKPSPFQKAAQEKEAAAAAAATAAASAAATDEPVVEGRVLDAVDSAETTASAAVEVQRTQRGAANSACLKRAKRSGALKLRCTSSPPLLPLPPAPAAANILRCLGGLFPPLRTLVAR